MAFAHVFFNALVFFTRLPAPGWVIYDALHQRRAVSHAPLIGWLVGALAALVLLACAYILPLPVAVVLSLISAVLITGALHEDGFADVCDGFGASRDKSRILAIMKDPRIGVYGALGLGLMLVLKYSVLVEIGRGSGLNDLALVLIAGHSVSRFAAVSLIYSQDYVSCEKESKSAAMTGGLAGADFLFALCCALLPFLLLIYHGRLWFLSALLAVLLVRVLLARLFLRRLGGYTGDCLGCVQQVSEAGFYIWICALVEL